jgi:hypothetical protein
MLHEILMNETSYGSTSCPVEVVAALQRTTCGGDDEARAALGECGITQEVFEEGEIVVTLPCGHHYKEASITQWLQQSNTCPFCRLVIE